MAERRCADLEVGASSSGRTHGLPLSPLGRRRVSYRALGSPRTVAGGGSRFFCEPRLEEDARHFLDSCFLCQKHLGGHRDIFMYRGDTPFCSEECRQEQIDADEAKENNWSNLPMKASSRKEQQQQKAKSAATEGIHARTAGTVVAG